MLKPPPTKLRIVPPDRKLRRYQQQGVKRLIEILNKRYRALLADEPGCLSGDTEISYSRAGITRKTTLADLWEKSTRKGRNAWNPKIPTKIKALCDGELRLHEVTDILRSGVKLTYTLLLESGKSIRATEDHEFLKSDGTWEPLRSLSPGDTLLTNGTPVCKECGSLENVSTYQYAKFRGVCKTCIYRTKRDNQARYRDAGRALPAGQYFDKDGYVMCSGYYCHPRRHGSAVRQHVLVMEAHLGRYLTKDEFVHHIDHNKANNALENLQLVTTETHALLHPEKKKHLSRDRHGNEIVWVPQEDRIVSITPYKREPVYDIKMRGPHHNFVANKIIVHNCGKTCQALVVSNVYKSPAVLIVAPPISVDNWGREWRMWDVHNREVFCVEGKESIADYKGEPVIVVSDGSLHLLTDLLPQLLARSSSKTPALLLADELHRFKNWEAQRTDRLFNHILPQFHHFIGITGTPITNKISDLHAIASSCAPDLFPAFKTFCETFSKPVFDGYAVEYRGVRNVNKLRKKLSKFMVRRYKADVLKQMPAKIYHDHFVRVDQKLAERSLAYVAYAKQMIQRGGSVSGVVKDEEGENLATMRRELGIAKIPHIVDYCDLLMQGGSAPLVLFAHHREVVEDLEVDLDARGFRVGKIYGGMNSRTKTGLIHDFQNGHLDTLVCSIKAAGFAITLTASSNAIFGELTYVPSDLEQCEDRVHRFGQTRGVMIHRILAENSLDDKICASLWEKERVINKVVGKEKSS